VGDACSPTAACANSRSEGTQITVLFVSHDLGLVKQLSDRAILLLNGRIAAQGAPSDVINRYIGWCWQKRTPRSKKDDRIHSSFRHGDGSSEILWRGNSERRAVKRPPRWRAASRSPCGYARASTRRSPTPWWDPDPHAHRMDVNGTNTRLERVRLGDFQPGDELEVDFGVECW